MLSIIIPAHNEQGYIGPCLKSLLAQEPRDFGFAEIEVIVAANACSDATVDEASALAEDFAARGWALTVMNLEQGGKPYALNEADKIAGGDLKAYLDADIDCDPDLFAELIALLDGDAPRYATGRLIVARAKSWWSRRYGKIYSETPFAKSKAPGCGLFAVNAAGRARWNAFPDLVSDDTFVRIQFSPDERAETKAGYRWPLPEGLRNIIHVRRRQTRGDKEIWRECSHQMVNADVRVWSRREKIKMLLRWPVSMMVYFFVNRWVARTSKSGEMKWSLGR